MFDILEVLNMPLYYNIILDILIFLLHKNFLSFVNFNILYDWMWNIFSLEYVFKTDVQKVYEDNN